VRIYAQVRFIYAQVGFIYAQLEIIESFSRPRSLEWEAEKFGVGDKVVFSRGQGSFQWETRRFGVGDGEESFSIQALLMGDVSGEAVLNVLHDMAEGVTFSYTLTSFNIRGG